MASEALGFSALAVLLAAMPAAAGGSRVLTGTVVQAPQIGPRQIMVHAERQFQTFDVPAGAACRREMTTEGTRGRPEVRTIGLKDLAPGEFVRLNLDEQGQVTEITAVTILAPARVRRAEGNLIVLDDANETALEIGTPVRFIDRSGKPASMASLKPGDALALFLNSERRSIYQVSAAPADVAAAGGNTVLPGTPLNARPTSPRLRITEPRDGDRVEFPLVVRGRSTPDTLVKVSLNAEGSRSFLLFFRRNYRKSWFEREVRADAQGRWATDEIKAPGSAGAKKIVVEAAEVSEGVAPISPGSERIVLFPR